MIYRLIVSYRGGSYAGWQRQDNALAVQQVVEEALGKLLVPDAEPASRPVWVVAASRTDAGVHALGQAVHLERASPFSENGLVFGTNRFLPDDVRVMAARVMEPGFHARKSASGKRYVYRLSRLPVLSPLVAPFVVRVDPRIDVERLEAATRAVVGRHDFSAFALAGGAHTDPHRTVHRAGWNFRGGREDGEGDELVFTIEGDGFLRGMVRSIVGTLIEIGLGRRQVEDIKRLVSGRPRSDAGPTAPAHGLVLDKVFYPPPWE